MTPNGIEPVTFRFVANAVPTTQNRIQKYKTKQKKIKTKRIFENINLVIGK